MTHLTNAAIEMLEDWKKNGFNGIRFLDCFIEIKHEADEETKEEFDLRSRNYTIFVAQPDYPENMGISSDPYVSDPVFDFYAFQRDLEASIKQKLGKDIEIKHYPNCHEFEITRT